MNEPRPKSILMLILRLLLSFVFIFSGFVKAVDPWGTAIKLGEYFQAFGMGWLAGASYFFSLALSATEMVLGFALLFRVRERLVSLLVMLFLLFFTVLTLILAVWDPVSDCGCFGDAIKLTNWQTFFKNLILLPCAIVLWRWTVKSGERILHPMLQWAMLLAFGLFSLGVGMYSLRYLPIVDFLPFRQGVHIPSGMSPAEGGETKTVLVYKDRTTGENHRFTLQDTVWYDSLRWEFVDTRFEEVTPAAKTPTIQEFSIFDENGPITPAVLASEREYFIVTLSDPARLTPRCRERLAQVAAYAHKNNYPLIGVTSARLSGERVLQLTENLAVPLYNMDGVTLRTLIRAHEGLVVLKEGVILGKWSCRDLPRFNEEANPVALSLLVEQSARQRENGVVGLMIVLWVLAYAVWTHHRFE